MDTTIDQQMARDEALVPHAKRLRIGRSNFRLLSDIKSKESTLQLVYDVLRLTSFFKAFLVTTDVEHNDTKKSNEMYYPRFTKVIIHHFMSKDPSIPRRKKVNWHYVRDEHMNSNAYKEYYAVATGVTPPKPKASVQKTKSSFDTTITPPTAVAGPRLTTSKKGEQPAKASKAKSLSGLSEVAMTEAQELKLTTKRSLQQTYISQASGSGTDEGTGDDDDDEDDDGEECNDGDDDQRMKGMMNKMMMKHKMIMIRMMKKMKESFDPIPKTLEDTDDEGNGEENLGLNVGREEGHDEEEEEDELYKTSIFIKEGVYKRLKKLKTRMYSIFETTSQMDVQTPTSVAPLSMSAPTITPSTIATATQQAPTLPTIAPSTPLQDLPNFGSLFGFDHRLKTLEANFSEFMQMNQFARAVSAIPEIVQRYMDQLMNEAVQVAIQIQSNHLCDEAQVDNDEFLKTIDENLKKIIKEPSNSSKTSYVIAADLSEMELKKILIEKIEGNKSIHQSNEQRNLYTALVEAYETDKIILDTYEETVTLKRRRDDDADKDEEPSAGSDRGSKRRREGKEPESASAPHKTATRSVGRSTQGSQSRQTSTSESATVEEPMQTTFEMKEPSHPKFETGADDQPITLPATHGSIQPWISELAKQSDSRSSFNELMDTPVDFSNFLINQLKVDTLTLKLLAGPTYELLKGSCKSLVELEYHLKEVYKASTDQLDWVNIEGQQYPHNLLKPLPLIPNNRGRRVIPFDHFINNDLVYLRGGASSRKYTTSVTKTKATDYGHIKWIEDLMPRTMWIQEPIGYDKHALWGVSYWGRKRQQFYGLLLTGSLLAMYILSKESSLLLNSRLSRKQTNLTVEERFAFNVSLRMFIRSIVIQRHMEDLQLSVESYQKKLNLTKPDTYRSDLKRKEAYIAYSNPRGFIY
nr:hypothetical protein [Tanacetum cinerariifolium]